MGGRRVWLAGHFAHDWPAGHDGAIHRLRRVDAHGESYARASTCRTVYRFMMYCRLVIREVTCKPYITACPEPRL